MTTFAEMNKLGSFQDFSFDLVAELIGNYLVRGKALAAKDETPAKLFNRVDWVVNRIGRVLNVAGKLDPAKTSFRVDRDADKIVHVRFIDTDENTLYTLDFCKEIADGKRVSHSFVLHGADGKELLNTEKWTDVRKFFAPEKTEVEEEVVAKAARPAVKKAKTEKAPAKKGATKKVKAPAKKAPEKAPEATVEPEVVAAPAEDDLTDIPF